MIKLSILIPITPERYETVKPLLTLLIGDYSAAAGFMNELKDKYWSAVLHSFKYREIEICIISDNKEMTLGEKRERLFKMAKGQYAWQIDSDDMIAENAIEDILDAIKSKPDCVTFEEDVEINGRKYLSNHSLKYTHWAGSGNEILEDGFHFQRSPFYKNVIKTEIAQSVPFPKIRWNEDEQWSMELIKILRTEEHIDKPIYFYTYNNVTETNEERYGFDKK